MPRSRTVLARRTDRLRACLRAQRVARARPARAATGPGVTFLECLGIKRGRGASSAVATDAPAPRQRETSSHRVVSPPPVDRPISDAPVAPPRPAPPAPAASAQSRPNAVAPASQDSDPFTVEELDLDALDALDATAGAPTVTRAAQPPAPSLPPDDELAHEGQQPYDDDQDYLTDDGAPTRPDLTPCCGAYRMTGRSSSASANRRA